MGMIMKKIELRSIEDLVYLAASSPFGATIQHFKRSNNDDVYFLMGGTITESFLYFVKGEETTKKFVCLDTTKNKITFEDLPVFDPKLKIIPIIEVKEQDLLE
jgi:hypothetical protein